LGLLGAQRSNVHVRERRNKQLLAKGKSEYTKFHLNRIGDSRHIYMPKMHWLLYFIEAQGYGAKCVGLYQDNISMQLLIKNGKFSSG
jgi:hypothetical protein